MYTDPDAAARNDPSVIEGAVARRLRLIDLDRVLYAYERVIDELGAVFAVEPYGRSKAVMPFPEGEGVYWPYPGKDRCHSYWRHRAAKFAVCGEAVWHTVGTLKVRAHLLGEEHLIFDPVTRSLCASRRRNVQEVDTVPRIAILGTGNRVGVDEEAAALIERVVQERLGIFRFALHKEAAAAPERKRTPRVAFTIVFSHIDFFSEDGWGLVRCLDPHGRLASNRPRRC